MDKEARGDACYHPPNSMSLPVPRIKIVVFPEFPLGPSFSCTYPIKPKCLKQVYNISLQVILGYKGARRKRNWKTILYQHLQVVFSFSSTKAGREGRRWLVSTTLWMTKYLLSVWWKIEEEKYPSSCHFDESSVHIEPPRGGLLWFWKYCMAFFLFFFSRRGGQHSWLSEPGLLWWALISDKNLSSTRRPGYRREWQESWADFKKDYWKLRCVPEEDVGLCR